jgi:hypothetical protein
MAMTQEFLFEQIKDSLEVLKDKQLSDLVKIIREIQLEREDEKIITAAECR